MSKLRERFNVTTANLHGRSMSIGEMEYQSIAGQALDLLDEMAKAVERAIPWMEDAGVSLSEDQYDASVRLETDLEKSRAVLAKYEGKA